MSILSVSHYSFFPGLFAALTYNKKERPVFGAALAFSCILLPFLGLSFCHLPTNLSNYNVLTFASSPFFYQISGTWSHHEGSLLSWCWISSFSGFLLCYRGRAQSHHASKRRGSRETLTVTFLSNFVKKSTLSLQQQSVAAPQLYTPFVRLSFGENKLNSRRKRTTFLYLGPTLSDAPLDPSMSSVVLGAGCVSGLRGRQRTHQFLHLARAEKERASSLDEEQSGGALGIAFFFSLYLLASSDPFVRNFFVRTEPLAESNPVPQDPILAIHPPCIYAGDLASAIGFSLCRSTMMNGIVALHSPPMRKDLAQKNGTLLRSAGCVGSHLRSAPFIYARSFTHFFFFGAPALFLRSKKSLLKIYMLRRRFFALSSLWTGALMDRGPIKWRAQRLVRQRRKGTTASPLSWTAGANTVVSDQEQEPTRIWILTCRFFLTVGISLGSWWAHHELGWGGWWFRDPVENASLMPWVLATASLHSVILPLTHSLTLFLNILTLTCCLSGTSSIRSGLLAPVHSSATNERGLTSFWFLLLPLGSLLLFYQMKRQVSFHRTSQKEMVVARKTLVHLRESTRAQARP